jgi:methylmalonyl-CoA/ethylmalonyl-CoA epimerase
MTAPVTHPGIEALWPAAVRGAPLSYAALADAGADALRAAGVAPRAFSHVGIVVANVGDTLRELARTLGEAWGRAEPVWGEAFGCRIARHSHDGVEYEFIEPERDSFLRRFLREHGPGVQHLSFEVADLASALHALQGAGVERADPDVHQGLHGRIAFVRPEPLAPLCIELCEVAS